MHVLFQYKIMKYFPTFSEELSTDPTTRRIWYSLATVNDFELFDSQTEANLYNRIFQSHFFHLAIIFFWTAGNTFHIAWQRNFEQFVQNPLKIS